MKLTAEQLYREDEAEYNAEYRHKDFGAWEDTVQHHPRSVAFWTEQALILNALLDQPEEDEFGPITVPVLPATKTEFLIAQWKRYGVYESRVERCHKTYGNVPLWIEANLVEKFAISKLYRRVASVIDDGLGSKTIVMTSDLLDMTDKAKSFRALLSHEDSDSLFEVTSQAEYDKALEAGGVDDVTGIPAHEERFKRGKEDPDDGL